MSACHAHTIFQFTSTILRKIVGQGPTALVVGEGGSCLDIFSLVCRFSFLSPSLWETARYKLKYCLKGPLSPNNQPTNYQHQAEHSFSPLYTGRLFHFIWTSPLVIQGCWVYFASILLLMENPVSKQCRPSSDATLCGI